MTRSDLSKLRDRLTDCDRALLRDADTYRLLTTRQLQRLRFDPDHPTPLASARACNRALARLRDAGVLRALQRRIGGARAGSAGFVWYVGPAGDRLLRALDHPSVRRRRNHREPSRYFVDHTLAVAELAVQATEASRRAHLALVRIDTEPDSWQPSLGPHGTPQHLKPDLLLVTADDAFEHHWFVEADLATEHLPVITRQCVAYQTFRSTGRYQAAHGLFPAVLWVTPTSGRAAALRAAVAATPRLDEQLFRVCTTDQFPAVISRPG